MVEEWENPELVSSLEHPYIITKFF